MAAPRVAAAWALLARVHAGSRSSSPFTTWRVATAVACCALPAAHAAAAGRAGHRARLCVPVRRRTRLHAALPAARACAAAAGSASGAARRKLRGLVRCAVALVSRRASAALRRGSRLVRGCAAGARRRAPCDGDNWHADASPRRRRTRCARARTWRSTSLLALLTLVRAQAGSAARFILRCARRRLTQRVAATPQRTFTAAKSCCCCSWPQAAMRCPSSRPAAELGASLPRNAARARQADSPCAPQACHTLGGQLRRACMGAGKLQATALRVCACSDLRTALLQTHGRRSFSDLLPALAALDSWRGAARCVCPRDLAARTR